MTAVSLPSHILSSIFLILRDNNVHQGFLILHPSTWIYVTWVCRSWRDAAFERASLWTTLFTRYRIRHPEAIHAFLSRAPDIAIRTVVVSTHGQSLLDEADTRKTAFQALLPWKDSIRLVLDIDMSSDSGSQIAANVNVFLGGLRPALKAIGFSTPCNKGRPIEPFDLDVQGLLGLEHIRFSSAVPVPPTNGVLWGVRALKMSDVHPMRPGHLQEFFAACPDLEDLSLIQTYALSSYLGVARPIVHLPRLRRLAVDLVPPELMRSELAAFRFPPTASIWLGVHVEALPTLYRVQNLLGTDAWLRNTLLPEDLNNLGSLPDTRSLTVYVFNGSCTCSSCPTPRPSGEPLPLQFRVAGYPRPDSVRVTPHWDIQGTYHRGALVIMQPQYFERFLRGIPLIGRSTLLLRLHLHLADWLSPGFQRSGLWVELFGQLPELQILGLGGWECIEAATRALLANPLLLPRLDRLCLCISRASARADPGATMVEWLAARHAARPSMTMGLRMDVGGQISLETRATVEKLAWRAKAAVPALKLHLAVKPGMCRACWGPPMVPQKGLPGFAHNAGASAAGPHIDRRE